ncbi:copia protein, partial [Tanacetum coccineum]
MNVSPILTSRINSIHPSTLILGDPQSAFQTRSKVTKSSRAHAFVYRNKKDERGVMVRNKAKLVAQGHRQEEGIDYDEGFAPVARIEAIRIFLAFASYMGFIVYQRHAKSAFLYGKIDEEVYVSQPPGFIDPKRGTIDKTLIIKKDKHDIKLVQVYVDDIIFGSTKKSWCDEFEALMKSRFQMSSMGELTFFIGLQVKQKEDGIFISQDKYVAEILKKFVFVSVKTASTPIETQKPLVQDEPDIMYLKGKPKLGLRYPRVSSFDLEAYSDSDYGGANLDRKSTTGEEEYIAAANCCFSSWLLLLEWSIHKLHYYLGFRESLERALDGTKALLLQKLFILWLAKVSTDSAKLIPLGKDITAIKTLEKILPRIIDFLARSSIHNALTVYYYQSSWQPVSISEASIRSDLLFYDANGIDSLPNQAIFDVIQLMGYDGDLT